MAAAEPAHDVALDELEVLLCGVAAGQTPNRASSTGYSNRRLQLIASPLRPILPGFVHQCVSLLRFREFITLYDPEVGERQRFVRERFEPCWTRLGRPRPDGAGGAAEPQSSHHWML